MLRCILQNIPKYVIKKYFQFFTLVSKLLLSYFYATFKQWLQEIKSLYTYFHSLNWFQIFMICT
jgi:hypothetical protein